MKQPLIRRTLTLLITFTLLLSALLPALPAQAAESDLMVSSVPVAYLDAERCPVVLDADLDTERCPAVDFTTVWNRSLSSSLDTEMDAGPVAVPVADLAAERCPVVPDAERCPVVLRPHRAENI